MSSGEARTVNQFALVSYVPQPLSDFLDHLRIRLTPQARPRAHVTALPPRPVSADLTRVKSWLESELRDVPPIWVSLGSIEVFPVSNVIYIAIAKGEADLRKLNRALDRGDLQYSTPFPYHPHITLAQDIAPEEVENLRRTAAETWASYSGEREFLIDSLWLVQNVTAGIWVECGLFPLALPAPVAP